MNDNISIFDHFIHRKDYYDKTFVQNDGQFVLSKLFRFGYHCMNFEKVFILNIYLSVEFKLR